MSAALDPDNMPQPLDPQLLAVLGNSLVGTLTPNGVQSQIDAVQQQALQQQAQLAQQASDQAQQAQQQYQQQAAAPAPEIDPFQRLLTTLGGNTASVLSQNPSYRQNAQTKLAAQQNDLMEARRSNLTALRDVYGQRAAIADKLGDIQTSEQYRVKLDRLNNQLIQMQEKQKLQEATTTAKNEQQNKIDLENLRAQNAERLARLQASLKGGSGSVDSEDLDAVMQNLAHGVTQLAQVPKDLRVRVQSEMAKRGMKIMPDSYRKAVDALSSAQNVVDSIANASAQVNTGGAGLGRFWEGLKHSAGALAQSDLPAADLQTFRGGLAGNLARAISAERGVLTDQDRKFALAMIPDLYDSQDFAQRKLWRLQNFIAGKRMMAEANFTGDKRAMDEARSQVHAAMLGAQPGENPMGTPGGGTSTSGGVKPTDADRSYADQVLKGL